MGIELYQNMEVRVTMVKVEVINNNYALSWDKYWHRKNYFLKYITTMEIMCVSYRFFIEIAKTLSLVPECYLHPWDKGGLSVRSWVVPV